MTLEIILFIKYLLPALPKGFCPLKMGPPKVKPKHVCRHCKKGYVTAGSLKNHISLHHSVSLREKCPECGVFND
eukprot:TRINITY_DN4744_c0_g1_i1.p1 TRINITY_DN4744_c0_g1~~TRINITY_DN4744_c0_g1_i1.p1  ORF type:complete len:74 (-),score=5.21 TRINITY_DN4744_c0_g1_i1:280-501(-)